MLLVDTAAAPDTVALIPAAAAAAARARAIAESEATYCVFCGPDDSDPAALAAQAAYLDAHPQRPFQNWLGVAGESGVPDEQRYRQAARLIVELISRGRVPPPSVMVRRSVVATALANAPAAADPARIADAELALSSCLSFAIGGPEYVQIGPSDACNARCLFCLHHSPLIEHEKGRYKGMLEWDAWRRCLDDLAALGTPRIDYVGIGEPLMHPNIADALRYGSGRFKQNMITNGLLLGRHVDVVAEHLDWLTVSLNALTPATQHTLHLTGERGFVKTVEAIRQLTSMRDRRPQVSISFVVTRENFREISALPAFCQDLGIHAGLTPLGVYAETAGRLQLSDEERVELFAILDELAATPDHRVLNLEQFRSIHDRDTSFIVRQIPCYVGLIFAQVRGDGSVSHCCACDHASIGNIHERSFAELWRSAEYQRFRKDALFTIMATQQSLPGCQCDICGFAVESIRIHNRIHQTSLTADSLRASARH